MKWYVSLLILSVVLLIPVATFAVPVPVVAAIDDNIVRVHYSPVPDRDDADEDSVVYEYGFEEGWGDWTTKDLTDAGLTWHITESHAWDNGSSWWCGDEDINGYDNHWLQYLMTPSLNLSDQENLTLTFKLYYNCEDPDSLAPPADSLGYDGWDGCNVWISTDGGEEWEVITPTAPEYDYEDLYSFGEEWGMGFGIPGWAGFNDEWFDAEFDLSDYAQENVMIRWAFCSDPAWATGDDGDPDGAAIGMLVDEMQVLAGDQVLWENHGNEVNEMSIGSGETSGDHWEISDESGHESDHSAHCSIAVSLVNALITPPLQIPEEGFYTYFDFWMICNTAMSNSNPDVDNFLDDYFRVEYSTDEGVNWEDFFYDYGDPARADHPEWYDEWSYYGPDSWFKIDEPEWKLKLNLTQFAGETIQLRWVMKTDDVMDGEQGTGLWIDDFRLLTTSRSENDVGISYMNIGYPIGMGVTTDCQIIVKNFGMSTQNNVRKFFQINDGRATPITPWQGTLEPDSSLVYNFRLQNLGFAGGATITAWTDLNGDEEEQNNTGQFNVTVFPEGMYKLGYDSRQGRDEIRFAIDNGPAVLYTPTDDGVQGNYDILAVDVTWGAEEQEENATTTLAIYADRRGAPGDLLYSREITVTVNDLFPNKQHISLEDVDQLKNLDSDFWVYFNIGDQSQLPKPYGRQIVGNEPNLGQGHYFVSNGQQAQEEAIEYLIQAYIIKTEAHGGVLLPEKPEVDFDIVDPDSVAEIIVPVFGSSPEPVTITGVETDGDIFSAEAAEQLPFELKTGEYTNIIVTFTPQGVEDRWETNLTISCGDDVEPIVIRIKGRSTDSVSDKDSVIPQKFALGDAYPNPFNSTTVIPFAMPQAADVSLALYDLEGRMVTELISGRMSVGNHSVVLEAGDLTAGIYICRLESAEFSAVRKVVLVK
ncbi:T9SS type A sorting domain-containing protein [bacterium]|nr:T9SS type A sorting domain-containing protein [bacterium]